MLKKYFLVYCSLFYSIAHAQIRGKPVVDSIYFLQNKRTIEFYDKERDYVFRLIRMQPDSSVVLAIIENKSKHNLGYATSIYSGLSVENKCGYWELGHYPLEDYDDANSRFYIQLIPEGKNDSFIINTSHYDCYDFYLTLCMNMDNVLNKMKKNKFHYETITKNNHLQIYTYNYGYDGTIPGLLVDIAVRGFAPDSTKKNHVKLYRYYYK